jgi:hypothetical protein
MSTKRPVTSDTWTSPPMDPKTPPIRLYGVARVSNNNNKTKGKNLQICSRGLVVTLASAP